MALSDLLAHVFSRKPVTSDLSAAVSAAEQAVDAAGDKFHKSPSDDARSAWERARLDLDLARDRLSRAQADDARRAAKQAAAERAELVKSYQATDADSSNYLDATDDLQKRAVDHVLALVDLAIELQRLESDRRAKLAPLREMAPQLTLSELGLQERFEARRDALIAEDDVRAAQDLPRHSADPSADAEREVRREHQQVLARHQERAIAHEIAARIGQRVTDKLARERPNSEHVRRLVGWCLGGMIRNSASAI